MSVKKDTKIHLWAKPVGGEWEWIDTADEHNSKDFLLENYKIAYGSTWAFKWSDKQ